ncbi:chromosome transmission fidelity protein 8 homolog isoform X1 [Prorops nasuta]|uniref:chromosome transmission fidelity protein 8 homolog isoform X1 n=1 Tax=Prorops nasuta TaxID=863751 RepID=UPI0034CE6ECF
MIIYIKRDAGKLPEHAVIELQGDLKFDNLEHNDQCTIGDIHYTKLGNPIFIIGIHILHGKEEKLSKPFALIEKRKLTNPLDSRETTEYVIKGIVRKKLIFKARPKPIITNVPKSI